jgi:hypothetical protein
VDPRPDPHQSDKWIRIRNRIKVISWILTRIKVISWIRILINLQKTSQIVWNLSLFEHFVKGYEPLFESRDPDSDPHQSDEQDPDPHHSDADPQYIGSSN